MSAHRSCVRGKRAADSSSKKRFSRRLAAKEPPYYIDAVTKASRVKVATFDFTGVSAAVVSAIEDTGILARPAPAATRMSRLRSIGRECGLTKLRTLDAMVSDSD